MPAPAEITCPRCQATKHRSSRWHSHDEKLRHPGAQAYRCLSCGHRHITPIQPTGSVARAPVARLGFIVAIVLALVALLAIPETDEFESVDASLASLERSPLVASETLRAAEAGNADAQFKVGRSLLYDALSDKDKALVAVDWLQKAADNGSTAAMVHLGRMYRTGIGTLQNFDLAAQWVLRAAENDDPEGMLEVGRIYRDGVGVEPDLIQSYVWFNRAAAKLNMEAARERDGVMRRLDAEGLKNAQRLSLEIEPSGIIGVSRQD